MSTLGSTTELQPPTEAHLFGEIERGMPVYDAKGTRCGTVARIYIPATQTPDRIEMLLLGISDMPSSVANRLRNEGCLRVDTGLWLGDYFVLPHQIGDIKEDGIFLLFHDNELIPY